MGESAGGKEGLRRSGEGRGEVARARHQHQLPLPHLFQECFCVREVFANRRGTPSKVGARGVHLVELWAEVSCRVGAAGKRRMGAHVHVRVCACVCVCVWWG